MGTRPDLTGYVEVRDRVVAFIRKYPEGSIQMSEPKVMTFALPNGHEVVFLAGCARAYRTPDDKRPGVGWAWEPVPGLTAYTRGSELMNLETSAWGRALASLGFGVDRSIASAQEVAGSEARANTVEAAATPNSSLPMTDKQRGLLFSLLDSHGIARDAMIGYCAAHLGREVDAEGHLSLTRREASDMIKHLQAVGS